MNDVEYKGYYITKTNDHDSEQYVVQYDGQDKSFDDEEHAKSFIDSVTEADKKDDKDDEEPSHFDIEPDEVEPEEPEYDEDDVLLEEPEDNEDADIAPVENPNLPRVAPYSTKDLALGVIDLLNSDTMDYNTGVYDKQEDAFDKLAEMKIFAQMPEEDWTAVVEDFDTAVLQKFIEDHPKQADFIFNTVAKVFGFTNYEDYKTYLDNIGEEDTYLLTLAEPDEDIEEIRYGIPTDPSPYDYEDDEDEDELELIDINDAFGVTESKQVKKEDIYDKDDKFVYMNDYDVEDWLDLIYEYIGMDASNAFKKFVDEIQDSSKSEDYSVAMKDAIADLKKVSASIRDIMKSMTPEASSALREVDSSISDIQDDLKYTLKVWGDESLKESKKLKQEVTNTGAIVNVPAKHKRIDLDEEDVEVLNELDPDEEE